MRGTKGKSGLVDGTQWEGGTPLTPGTRQKGVQLRCILVRAGSEGSPGIIKMLRSWGGEAGSFYCYRSYTRIATATKPVERV